MMKNRDIENLYKALDRMVDQDASIRDVYQVLDGITYNRTPRR